MNAPGNLVDPGVAAEAVQAWAAGEPVLAGLLASGLTMVQATARWGLLLLKANRAADAVSVFRAAASLRPGDPALWLNLGIAFDRAGSPADAAGCVDRSLALAHDQPDAWNLLGVIRGKLGDGPGAEAAHRAALALDPKSVAAWQCLGILKEQERDCASAIECFRACVALGQPSPATWANLGRLYYQIGAFLDARGAYEAAVTAEPSNKHYAHMLRRAQFLRDVFEGASVDDALAAYERAASTSEETERERLDLLEVASGLFGHWGHSDAAIRVAKKRLELRPESAAAKYLLSALVAEPGVDRSPADYIVENFDAFAEQFEAKVVGVLGYDVPEQLCAVARALAEPGGTYAVLDAGCGTGLCGPLLRPLARSLVGVDLSSKMLELAARRGVYDTLFREELTTFLGRSPERYDLIVAADVLIYFGDLTGVLGFAATALRPGGLLVFSTELLHVDGYRILPTGRFAHSPGYVKAAAAPRLVQERCIETTLRLDTSARVAGNLFAFRRVVTVS